MTTIINNTIETDSNNNSLHSYSRGQVMDSNNNNNNNSSDKISSCSVRECCNNSNNNSYKTSSSSSNSSTTTKTMLNLIVNKCTTSISTANDTKSSNPSSSPSSLSPSSSTTTKSDHNNNNHRDNNTKWFNVSNICKSTTTTGSNTPTILLIQSTFLVTLLLLSTTINVVSSDSALGGSNNNVNVNNANNNIPDQIAMAAEHRIGQHGGGQGGGGASYGSPMIGGNGLADDNWPLASSHDMPQIKILQVQCEKSHMRVNIEFDRPFYGMIFSKGYYSDPHCIHLAPGSGHLSATFDIYLDACGMSSSANGNSIYGPAPSGTFVENTIIIQYDPLVQEVWDQARKLRCTWYDFYEKSVTFRPFQVDMLHAVTANFLGDNLQCWMQIQVGKGPWASEVSGIVKIGQTMTMVLAIKDDENKFDMLVRNCVAHDGKRAPIQLVDAYGCVTRPKIMSRFHKIKNFGASASVVSYAYFQAFKFPDSMNVHFQCVIQVCRFQCPEPKCGGEDVYGPPLGLPGPGVPDPRHPHGAYSEPKEQIVSPPSNIIPEALAQNSEPISNSIVQQQQQQRPQQPGPPHPHHQQPMRGPPLPPPPHRNNQYPPHHHLHPHPHHPQQQHPFNKQQQIPVPMPMPGNPSTIMLPPMPMPGVGYSNVKREGVILDEDNNNAANNGANNNNGRNDGLQTIVDLDELENDGDDDDEEEEQEPSFAALGGRPRSVDFNKKEILRQRRAIHLIHDGGDQHFVVHMSHVYKREAQEMTDVETTRVIQVVAPGDVAFNLNGNGRSSSNSSLADDDDENNNDSIIIESSLRGSQIDGICMSVSSFVGGLVMLLLLLVVSSLVAAFLFVRVRSIHVKTSVFSTSSPVVGSIACYEPNNSSTEYLKQASS